MRSACWGARSLRSLKTIRPLVVSTTIAFCLSRPAGSGCAIAGAAQISATMKTRAWIMKTPDMNVDDVWSSDLPANTGSHSAECALAREFGFQASGHRGRHERRNVPAHASDLAHQCGGDRAGTHGSRDEHRMHVRRHGLVHAGNLHLIIEVRAIAQAANHDGGTSLLCRGDRELVVAGAIELTTGLGRNRRKHLAH